MEVCKELRSPNKSPIHAGKTGDTVNTYGWLSHWPAHPKHIPRPLSRTQRVKVLSDMRGSQARLHNIGVSLVFTRLANLNASA